MSIKQTFYKIINFIKYKRAIFVYNKKINNILLKTKIKNLRNKEKLTIKNKFNALGFKNISLKWHQFYCHVYGKILTEFIPESLYYTQIEGSLNRSIMFPAMEDKNLLDYFLSKDLLPEVVVKNINGFFYVNDTQTNLKIAAEKCLEYDQLVIKPTIGTAGGFGVKKIELLTKKDGFTYLKELFAQYKSDFNLQVILQQHEAIEKLNKSSINTLRIMSYMNNQGVHILSSVIRIGRMGSFTDNMTMGGIGCGIDGFGKLKKFAYDSFGASFEKSDCGVTFNQYQIPLYDSILEIIKTSHKKLPYFKLISWDVMITVDSKIKIVEYNTLGQDINLHQLVNGPLFGNYFDEIMEITRNHDFLTEAMKYGK
ncbi:hypothetical protein LCGC14_0132130 [marine sediment metagenome]|uniref:Alpha-L-glutamate ligase-related protein ATP-grasp domain-containing protein n=1 Tax=marine sediment metagenome TaxID=412755 RepID=A0A0F9VJ20_9ZZZZ|nr:sugar-transfer associated ATP-grasp domain-containing protein [Maribacter sp.]HDZ03949.1 hypothetical protein [Maribacter sp.]HEC39449.1 hypothetical protein [bacterium]